MEKSRAIELLEHLAWDRDIDRNPCGDALRMAIDALKAQHSSEGTTKDATSDLISRQAAIDAIANCTNCENEKTLREYATKHSLENGWTGGVLDALDAVKDLPPAQPERKKGRWLPDNNSVYEMRFICSECKESEVVPTIGFTKYKPIWDYCPNCGADMRGEKDG